MKAQSISTSITSLILLFNFEAMAEECCYYQENDCVEQETCVPECSSLSCCCKNYYYIGADYLYMRAWQGGTDRAGVGPLFTGEIKSIDFDWDHGFRVYAGADFCCDWGISGTYTYLRPSGKKTIEAETIFPTTLPQFVVGGVNFTGELNVFFETGEANFSKIRSSIDLNYNLIDIELAKFFRCTPCFDFYVSTGVQIALMDETITDFFAGVLSISINQIAQPLTTGIIPIELNWVQSWDFDGAGLRLGASGNYQLGCGFFLGSDFHLAVLFGEYKTRNNRNILLFDTSDLSGLVAQDAPFFDIVFNEYYFVSMQEKFHDFVSNVQLDLGIGWEYWCKCVGFKLKAAYEMFYWWDLVVYRQGAAGDAAFTSANDAEGQFLFAGTSPTTKFTRDLGLHGLVISLDIVF